MASRVARLCIVTGRVQGVFFRASTAEQAQRLGLSGHAINLPDGTVEVLVAGPAVAVDELCRWLHEGPPMARVSKVKCSNVAEPPETGFNTG